MAEEQTPTGLRERAEFARALARRIGKQAMAALEPGVRGALATQLKGPQDFVTAADKAAEAQLRRDLAARFPQDGFFGEETGGRTDAGALWVVDPIDGTANFMRALPEWCVSLAFVAQGRVRIGVVYDAPFDIVYWAIEGQGAWADAAPLPAGPDTPLEQSLAILGRSNRTGFSDYLAMLEALQGAGADHRRFGSAALGLVRVAQGAADAYYEASLNAWDALAGALIAREAGCALHMPPLGEFLAAPGPVLAARGALGAFILGAAPAAVRARLVPMS